MDNSRSIVMNQPASPPKRYGYALAVAAILVVSVGGWLIWSALPDPRTTTNTGVEIPSSVGFTQKLNGTVPMNVMFRDAAGEPQSLASLGDDGKPVILNLVYFQCPMLCHLSIDGLVRTLSTMSLRVGQDFHVVTISFDPREGPEKARAAKRTVVSRYGGDDDGWHFLTGDPSAIDQITEAVGFGYEYDERSGQFAHAAGVVVLTPQGRISRYLSGVDYAARDLRLSLVEASENRIGTVADQAMLLCYRYDPLTGKYGLAIARAIQLAGILTVFGVIGSIGFALERDRRGGVSTQDEVAASPAEGVSQHQ